jgi:hypothetical protein
MSEEMLRVLGVLGRKDLLCVELDRRVRSRDEPREEGSGPPLSNLASLYSCQGPMYIMRTLKSPLQEKR